MVIPLASKIKAWKDEADVKMILGVGDNRAFCAGGDIKCERSFSLEYREERVADAVWNWEGSSGHEH
jgi:enoyl-CoA hydratase/carnithine racemase